MSFWPDLNFIIIGISCDFCGLGHQRFPDCVTAIWPSNHGRCKTWIILCFLVLFKVHIFVSFRTPYRIWTTLIHQVSICRPKIWLLLYRPSQFGSESCCALLFGCNQKLNSTWGHIASFRTSLQFISHLCLVCAAKRCQSVRQQLARKWGRVATASIASCLTCRKMVLTTLCRVLAPSLLMRPIMGYCLMLGLRSISSLHQIWWLLVREDIASVELAKVELFEVGTGGIYPSPNDSFCIMLDLVRDDFWRWSSTDDPWHVLLLDHIPRASSHMFRFFAPRENHFAQLTQATRHGNLRAVKLGNVYSPRLFKDFVRLKMLFRRNIVLVEGIVWWNFAMLGSHLLLIAIKGVNSIEIVNDALLDVQFEPFVVLFSIC